MNDMGWTKEQANTEKANIVNILGLKTEAWVSISSGNPNNILYRKYYLYRYPFNYRSKHKFYSLLYIEKDGVSIMSKSMYVKDSTYEKLKIGKFNNSFSDVIDALIKDRADQQREIGLLKQEIGLLKLRNEVKA